MEWRDQGSLLTVQRFGESSAIIDVFTEKHGRHAGIVRGGASRKLRPILQPGSLLDVTWHARLEEHLGTFRPEPLSGRAALVLADRTALAALNAICGLLKFSLPEREVHPRLFAATEALLDGLSDSHTLARDYLQWELILLSALGFGLDIGTCAVTGLDEDLAFVSPKTGRAVSRDAAGDWAEKLLPYPDLTSSVGIRNGLKTT
ncbi:MAG: DNA repair protein RecO, partial [Alphaproteobacteria bacterium]|nr:DNA repair protein RecO [Alphaproteobacteria bacterium]